MLILHMEYNNCCGISVICGVPIPNVLEITWVNKKFTTGELFSEIDTLHPSIMEVNYKNIAPVDLSTLYPNISL